MLVDFWINRIPARPSADDWVRTVHASFPRETGRSTLLLHMKDTLLRSRLTFLLKVADATKT